jgi:hypothetical protein
MAMDYQDAIDKIATASARLRRFCEFADQCGRAGAAAVFYESANAIRDIDYARGVIDQSLEISRGAPPERLAAKSKPKGSRR